MPSSRRQEPMAEACLGFAELLLNIPFGFDSPYAVPGGFIMRSNQSTTTFSAGLELENASAADWG